MHQGRTAPRELCRVRRWSGQHQVVVDDVRVGEVEQTLALEVPLHVDRPPVQRARGEAAVKAGRGGVGLQIDVEDPGGDPLAEVSGGHGTPDHRGDPCVDRVAVTQQLGDRTQRLVVHPDRFCHP
jgi:hypothetical protein